MEISFNFAALHGTDLWFAGGGGEQAVFRGSQLTFDGASFAEFLIVKGLENPHLQEGASITRSGKPFRVKQMSRKVITTEVQFHKCDVCGS